MIQYFLLFDAEGKALTMPDNTIHFEMKILATDKLTSLIPSEFHAAEHYKSKGGILHV